jgi:hypothetical protein
LLGHINTRGQDVNLYCMSPLTALQAINGISVGRLIALE